MEIAPGIHQVKVPIPNNPLGHLNCYLVEGKNGWLMIDTGWNAADAFNSLQAGLKDVGLTLTDISTIVVTHVHADHFGLAGRIKHISPRAELLTHRWESDLIESRYIKFAELRDKMAAMLECHGVPSSAVSALGSASMPTLEFVTLAFPDCVLYGGEVISTGVYDLEVIWTPGHSPGHICLYKPRNRLLFSGDHILPGITPNVSYHVQSGDNPLGDYIGALRKLQNLPATKVLPAHEHIFTDLRRRIDQIAEHHELRKAEILKALYNDTHNAWEIASRLTWNVPGQAWEQFPPLLKRSAVTETIAHLECMRWEGKVQKITKGKTIWYALA